MSDSSDERRLSHVKDLDAARRIFAALGADEDNADMADGLPAIPGYTVLARLGQGGGGAVYRGVHEGSARPVAIKVLNNRLGSTSGAQRAWRELELLSQLHLPCMPRLLDYGEFDGRLFFVTEFVTGSTLEEHCEAEHLDRRDRVELLARVADAVQLVHERGVIHRDIKPANIIIDLAGDPVLVDFGIASVAAEHWMDTLTAEGSPIGSPAYMSPEQARGDRSAISTRSDVFGLGATAYRLLLGQTPFELDTTIHEAVRRVAQEEPREPRKLDPRVNRALASVLHKAVARRPEHRYATAAALAEDLRRWLRREPVEAHRPSPFRRALRTLGRHPVLATAGVCLAMIAVSLAGTMGLTWWLSMRPHKVQWNDEAGPTAEAWLVSADGRPLRSWGRGVQGAAEQLIQVRDGDRTRRLAFVGFGLSSPNQAYRGRLCAFDVDRDVDTPVWTRGVEDDQVPPTTDGRDYRANEFSARMVDAQDYFPNRPGLEIMALHVHNEGSLTTVQIYDLQGQLLYQFWHDGILRACYWMSGPGMLVLAGLNSEGYPNHWGWASRDPDASSDPTHPRVLFALRLREGSISRQVLIADEAVDSTSNEVAWYRCLPRTDLPRNQWGIYRLDSVASLDPFRVSVSVLVGSPLDGEHVSWVIDHRCQEVTGSRGPSDAYRTAWRTGEIIQPPEYWQLQKLPPLLDPAQLLDAGPETP